MPRVSTRNAPAFELSSGVFKIVVFISVYTWRTQLGNCWVLLESKTQEPVLVDFGAS